MNGRLLYRVTKNKRIEMFTIKLFRVSAIKIAKQFVFIIFYDGNLLIGYFNEEKEYDVPLNHVSMQRLKSLIFINF